MKPLPLPVTDIAITSIAILAEVVAVSLFIAGCAVWIAIGSGA